MPRFPISLIDRGKIKANTSNLKVSLNKVEFSDFKLHSQRFWAAFSERKHRWEDKHMDNRKHYATNPIRRPLSQSFFGFGERILNCSQESRQRKPKQKNESNGQDKRNSGEWFENNFKWYKQNNAIHQHRRLDSWKREHYGSWRS